MSKPRRKIFTLKNKRRLPLWLAYPFSWLVHLLLFSCKLELDEDAEAALSNTAPAAIFACWHGRIILGAAALPRRLRKRLVLLISRSRDGEYIATMARLFKFQVARGSSSRGGGTALLMLKRALDRGVSPLIAVDGPRGPRHRVHSGIVTLAALSSHPIVPVCFDFSRYITLKSWDAMRIPLPFSRIRVSCAAPLYVSKGEEPSEIQAQIGQILSQLCTEAEKGGKTELTR